ncbi:WYL domain-containing protein [Aliarcobacter butzleri]|uniref:WYL domain-containing protein n=1 Tax=Aliarcobacter butzleri TaxID=28197 RepID=UPI00263EBA09|nr:WYL domain-containing protein [Aliarcobacter butzleri]MDN5048576.1 WYL domain-containing protein [Aliarcobacter butzleri]MDN5056678.1 WYL domain-containing protein [Aliarcobacter butzleri]
MKLSKSLYTRGLQCQKSLWLKKYKKDVLTLRLTPILVQLFIDKEVSRYFLRKPLNKTQRVLKTYDDESVDIELTITNFMEIIPTIQRYIPHIGVIEPDELKSKVKENVEMYLKRFD